MRVAVVTDDGVQVSKHFGRAAYYLVVEIEGSTIKDRKLIPKLGHSQFHDIHETEHEELHMGSEAKHTAMSRPLEGCAALICGGMGMGAYQSLLLKGVKPIITELESADEALNAYILGRIDDHPEYLH